jgi:hypothetical protein
MGERENSLADGPEFWFHPVRAIWFLTASREYCRGNFQEVLGQPIKI